MHSGPGECMLQNITYHCARTRLEIFIEIEGAVSQSIDIILSCNICMYFAIIAMQTSVAEGILKTNFKMTQIDR